MLFTLLLPEGEVYMIQNEVYMFQNEVYMQKHLLSSNLIGQFSTTMVQVKYTLLLSWVQPLSIWLSSIVVCQWGSTPALCPCTDLIPVQCFRHLKPQQQWMPNKVVASWHMNRADSTLHAVLQTASVIVYLFPVAHRVCAWVSHMWNEVSGVWSVCDPIIMSVL